MRQPLGIAIVGGLILSQVLTLYTTPVIYLYLDRFRLWSQRLRGGGAAPLQPGPATGRIDVNNNPDDGPSAWPSPVRCRIEAFERGCLMTRRCALSQIPERAVGGRLASRLALPCCCSARRCPAASSAAERPELNLEVPAAYREAPQRAPDAAVPALDWWRGFRSSELTTLMEAAQIYNLDIAVAMAQIVQADAQVGVSGAPLLPSVTGTANAEQQKHAAPPAAIGGGVRRRRLDLLAITISA